VSSNAIKANMNMPKKKKKIIQEDTDAEFEDITKIIPKSNSKIDDLREIRVGEIMNKSENAGKQLSNNIVKEAEERKEKKRKQKKKKIIDAESSVINNTTNNETNTVTDTSVSASASLSNK